MKKCNLMPLIHKYTLQEIEPNKYHWGWRCQTVIKDILKNVSHHKYQPNMFDETIQEKIKFNEPQFLLGVSKGYETIFNDFKNKQNFNKKNYTTPELSRALNYINKIQEKNDFIYQKPDVKILTSSILIEYAKSNDKIFGYFDIQELQNDIPANLWDVYVGPLKQNVRVLYNTDNELYIWDWERSLIGNNEWTVANINEILI